MDTEDLFVAGARMHHGMVTVGRIQVSSGLLFAAAGVAFG